MCTNRDWILFWMWLNLIGWKCGASRPGQSQSEGDQNRSNRELLSTLNWTRLNYSTPWNNFRLYRELRFCWCTVFLWVTLFMKLLCFLQCIFFFLFNFLPLLFFFNRCCFFKFFSFFFFCDLPGFFLSLLISTEIHLWMLFTKTFICCFLLYYTASNGNFTILKRKMAFFK